MMTTLAAARAALVEVPGTHGRYSVDPTSGEVYSNITPKKSLKRERMGSPFNAKGRLIRYTTFSFSTEAPPDPDMPRLYEASAKKGTDLLMYGVITSEIVYRTLIGKIPPEFTVGFKNGDTLDERPANLYLIRKDEIRNFTRAVKADPVTVAKIQREFTLHPQAKVKDVAEKLRLAVNVVSEARKKLRATQTSAARATPAVDARAAAEMDTKAEVGPKVERVSPEDRAAVASYAQRMVKAVASDIQVITANNEPRAWRSAVEPREVGHIDAFLALVALSRTVAVSIRSYEDEVIVLKVGDKKLVAESIDELVEKIRSFKP